MHDFGTVFLSFVATSLLMTLLWWRTRVTKNATVVDVAWAGSITALVALFALTGDGSIERRLVAFALGVAWAGRLAWHLYRDRVRMPEEDGRYRALREHWGEQASRNFFFVFQAQAVAAVLFSLPYSFIANDPRSEFSFLDLIGLAVWICSIGGEAVADAQLARFRGNPANRGKTCRAGLWRYSRHPNYFFEWLHWWAYVLISANPWLTVFPILMLIFLFRVSGIPYTELQALRTRGDDYREYQRTTNAFFPWFPRRR